MLEIKKKEIEKECKNLFEKYEKILKENFEIKYKNYFIKYENSINVIEARNRYRKAKNKNKELFDDFNKELYSLIFDSNNKELNIKDKKYFCRIYKTCSKSLLFEINKINEEQTKLLKEFMKNKGK